MKSSVIKRSVAIAGHKTSVSLEDAFWKISGKSRMPNMQRCRMWSQRSTRSANRATYLQRSVCSYSTRYARLRLTAPMWLQVETVSLGTRNCEFHQKVI